ncbi:PepSY domain-containing protein [Methylobacterium sp. J-088]|uniref:PepSY domain-containing protein n=1 Tax=unclassified Methylobacterium TaxID=2615210 RepID=UPI001FB8DA15|nr:MULTISPECIES: PepSY domain-containing protein [unclassified Methylobacterium]MCJ2062391.1 PepSY domain-containing protein [Methylobacterium sp. J-088]
MNARRTASLCLLAVLAGAPASASEDADRARQALEKGEIRPLDEILHAAREAVPGDVVSVDLKRDDGRWRYKLRILGADGKRRTVKVDAGSAKILDDDDDD